MTSVGEAADPAGAAFGIERSEQSVDVAVRPRGWMAQVAVVVACGDPDAERTVLDAIGGAGDGEESAFHVVRRCLSAPDLLSTLESQQVDVAVVGTDLHGLGTEALSAVVRAGVPLIVLAGSGLGEPRWKTAKGSQQVLPADATGDQVREALRRVTTGGTRARAAAPVSTRSDEGVSASAVNTSGGRRAHERSTTATSGTVVAFTGACDGLGSSTVAANVGAVLGRRATTVLVEADTLAPSFAAALGLDPARNVYLVAHERPGSDAQRWAQAMATELQPLDVASPHAVVLCGVPRPSLRTALDPAFVTSLLDRLRAQAELVLVDIPAGHEEGTTSAALHAAVLEGADRILITTTPDIVGLRRTAAFIEWLVGRPGGVALRPRLSLVLNRHRPRHHADPAEIAEVLRVPVAGTIPDDAEAMQRSLDLQRPAVGCSSPRRGSAARALEDLAGRIEASHHPLIRTDVSEPRRLFSAPWRRR